MVISSLFCLVEYSSVAYLDSTLLGLDIRIADLSVVNNNGIATGATGGIVGPTNALGELGIGVRQEELRKELM